VAATRLYSPRTLDDEFGELAASLPALALEGPKAVGKTTTALQRAATVHRLDDPAARAVAAADPERLLNGPFPVLIDVWQKVPEVWDLVRRAVDDGAPPGAFILTGSALPEDLETHSGAGRIVTIRMRPLSLAERGVGSPSVSVRELLTGSRSTVEGQTIVRLENYVDEILASGFPGLRGLSGRALRAQLDTYIARIVDHDFEEMGHPVRRPATLRSWMAAYAAASSTTASWERIRDSATSGEIEKPARSTTLPYRDVLERLWILDPVAAWLPTRNHFAQLAAAPKHQLADPALAARLLGLDAGTLLHPSAMGHAIPRDGTLLGALFESLVTLGLRVYAQAAEASVKHLRTQKGDHEVDLIVERADGRVVAVEVKLSRTVDDHDVRHLKWLAAKFGDDLLDSVILTTGDSAYRRADGIAVVPAALLGA
jgi:uncharacterized protein